MAIYISKNGTVSLYKGDSGNITFSGLPTDKAYAAHFAFYDPDTGSVVGDEFVVDAAFSPKVTFQITANSTDKLHVEAGESFKILNYGFKIVSGDEEYTLIPKVKLVDGEPVFEQPPLVYVYPKYVEGN